MKVVNALRILAAFRGLRKVYGGFMPIMTQLSGSKSGTLRCLSLKSKVASHVTTRSKFEANLLSRSRVIAIYTRRIEADLLRFHAGIDTMLRLRTRSF